MTGGETDRQRGSSQQSFIRGIICPTRFDIGATTNRNQNNILDAPSAISDARAPFWIRSRHFGYVIVFLELSEDPWNPWNPWNILDI